MGFKTISLSDEAYRALESMKLKGESFTSVVLRLCSKKDRKPLASFSGSWVMSDQEEKEIFGEVSEAWREYEKSLLGHRLPSRVIEEAS